MRSVRSWFTGRPHCACFNFGVAVLLTFGLTTQPAALDGQPIGQRRILVCGKQTAVVLFSPERPAGAVEWTYPVNSREGWVLPNGNVLLAVSRGSRLPTDEIGAGRAAIEIHRGPAWPDSIGD